MSAQQQISEKVKSIVRDLRHDKNYIPFEMAVERWIDHVNRVFNNIYRVWVDYGNRDYRSEAILAITNPISLLAIWGEFDEDREVEFKSERLDVVLDFDSAVISEYLEPLAYRTYKCRYYHMEDLRAIRCISEGVTRYLIFYPNNEVIALLRLTKLKPKVKLARMKGKVVEALQVFFGIADP